MRRSASSAHSPPVRPARTSAVPSGQIAAGKRLTAPFDAVCSGRLSRHRWTLIARGPDPRVRTLSAGAPGADCRRRRGTWRTIERLRRCPSGPGTQERHAGCAFRAVGSGFQCRRQRAHQLASESHPVGNLGQTLQLVVVGNPLHHQEAGDAEVTVQPCTTVIRPYILAVVVSAANERPRVGAKVVCATNARTAGLQERGALQAGLRGTRPFRCCAGKRRGRRCGRLPASASRQHPRL